MARDPKTAVRGGAKAEAMLHLWASVKLAARERALQDAERSAEAEPEPARPVEAVPSPAR